MKAVFVGYSHADAAWRSPSPFIPFLKYGCLSLKEGHLRTLDPERKLFLKLATMRVYNSILLGAFGLASFNTLSGLPLQKHSPFVWYLLHGDILISPTMTLVQLCFPPHPNNYNVLRRYQATHRGSSSKRLRKEHGYGPTTTFHRYLAEAAGLSPWHRRQRWEDLQAAKSDKPLQPHPPLPRRTYDLDSWIEFWKKNQMVAPLVGTQSQSGAVVAGTSSSSTTPQPARTPQNHGKPLLATPQSSIPSICSVGSPPAGSPLAKSSIRKGPQSATSVESDSIPSPALLLVSSSAPTSAPSSSLISDPQSSASVSGPYLGPQPSLPSSKPAPSPSISKAESRPQPSIAVSDSQLPSKLSSSTSVSLSRMDINVWEKDSDWTSASKVKLSGGLDNILLNCYMNSMLQLLRHCDGFVPLIQGLRHKLSSIAPGDQTTSVSQCKEMGQVIEDILKQEQRPPNARELKTTTNPQRFLSTMETFFNPGNQHDVSEAAYRIMEMLDNCAEIIPEEYVDIVNGFFRIKCRGKNKTDFVLSREIVQLPKVLMVSLSRISGSLKDKRRVFSEDIIDFGELVTKGGPLFGQSTTYELRAIVFHSGDTESGHYYTFIKKDIELEKFAGTCGQTKTMSFRWVLYDDSRVTPVTGTTMNDVLRGIYWKDPEATPYLFAYNLLEHN
ncbi:hypothetical protein B0O80DRAFT_486480 [Mortierella sp. GBAus27b]|nr:hypothetical protein B0O80DRAFT_486480 [Mortierella sp. GBAus27b]